MKTPDVNKPGTGAENNETGPAVPRNISGMMKRISMGIMAVLPMSGCYVTPARTTGTGTDGHHDFAAATSTKEKQPIPVRPEGRKTAEEIIAEENLTQSLEKTLFHVREIKKDDRLPETTRNLVMSTDLTLEEIASEAHLKHMVAQRLPSGTEVEGNPAVLDERINALRELQHMDFYWKKWMKITDMEANETAKSIQNDLNELIFLWRRDLESDPKYRLMQARERARGR